MQKGDRAADEAHSGTLFSHPSPGCMEVLLTWTDSCWPCCLLEGPWESAAAVTPHCREQFCQQPPRSASHSEFLLEVSTCSKKCTFLQVGLVPIFLAWKACCIPPVYFFPIYFQSVPCCMPESACSFVCFVLFYFNFSSWNQCSWDTGFYPAVKVGNKSLEPNLWPTQCRSTKHKAAAAGFLSCFLLFLER